MPRLSCISLALNGKKTWWHQDKKVTHVSLMKPIQNKKGSYKGWSIAMASLLVVALVVLGLVLSKGTVFSSGAGVTTEKGAVELNGVNYPKGVSSELYGKTSTLSLAAFDKESDANDQVAVQIHLWKASWDTVTGTYGDFEYIGNYSSSASARTSVTDQALVGDRIKAIAFDSTYDYASDIEFTVTSQNALKNLDTYKGSASATITFFNENGDAISNPTTSGNVTVGTTNYVFDKIRLTNTDDNSRVVPKILAFAYMDASNISEIKVSGLKAYTGEKIKLLSGLDDTYVWQPGNVNDDLSKVETGSVTIVPDGDNVASETVTVYVKDLAPYITEDNQLAYDIQDDSTSRTDVGMADISQAILLV